MDCSDFQHLVGRYLERGLPVRQERPFYLHALDCDDCGSYLHSYRIVMSLLKEQRLVV